MTIYRHNPVYAAGEPRLDLAAIPRTPAWAIDAACAEIGPDLFFPELGEGAHLAKKICAGCPVRLKCLEWALAIEGGALGEARTTSVCVGVYGGLAPRERMKILRERRDARLAAEAAAEEVGK